MNLTLLVAVGVLCGAAIACNHHGPTSRGSSCGLSPKLQREIQSYAPIANKIFSYVLTGGYKHRTWSNLATFVDKFGSRISGSENLERSIDYMLDVQKAAGLDNVHKEPAQVPKWVRGKEKAMLVLPRRKKLDMLGLGGSVGTPAHGIRAEVLVLKDFNELESRKHEVKGKIVLFNEKWEGYHPTKFYRKKAAPRCEKYGAVAALIASVTDYSIDSPHTGSFEGSSIPAAALTKEDAALLTRLSAAGEKLVIHLHMEGKNHPWVTSHNTISELVGSELPHESCIVSGHLDSWDVGQGAMDDAGGSFIAWNSLALLKELNLRPRRTLRSILWTAEEQGCIGAEAYFRNHKDEVPSINFVMESDEGTFNPLGLQFAGNGEAQCIMREIMKLMEPIGATQLEVLDSVGSDLQQWLDLGVPGVSLVNSNERYFWFHHTDGDTMSVQDPDEMDKCTALWATTLYILADLKDRLPRNSI